MKIITFLPVLILFSLAGCQDLALKENITGNYYFIASDAVEGTCLSYHELSDGSNYGCLIDAAVFGVGYNEKYIIAKQHPRTFPNSPNNNITNYFILPINKEMNWRNKNGLIGPLTLNEFEKKRIELNIPDDLTFTKELEFIK